MMKSIDRHEAATMLANHGFANISEDSVQGDEWRRYGKMRRLELLNRDQEEGENIFEINPTVRIDKYFQVINRSLDQFHAMYKDKERCNLEEIYVMGHRIQRFLIDFVPEHPEYAKPRSWHLRNRSRREVRTLQFCLEDIAILIDERLCNEAIDYTPEFDRILLQEESKGFHDQTPAISFGSSSFDNWVAFGGWHKERDSSQDESLDSTLNTTGSDSVENLDLSVDEDEIVSQNDGANVIPQGHENASKTTRVIFPLNLSESAEEDNFLYTIANQKFSFELDSDACDSWAQDHSFRQQKVKNFRDTTATTCDPAEIMFRHVLKTGCERMKFDTAQLEKGTGEDRTGDVTIRTDESRETIESTLESALGGDRFRNIARFRDRKDNGIRHMNAMRRTIDCPHRNLDSSGDDQTQVKLEDHYLVAGDEPRSELPSVEIGSTRYEELQFDNFDFNVLSEAEWIDFGDTGIDTF